MERKDIITKLTKQLFPTGRAWRISENSNFKKFIYALSISEADAIDFNYGILNSILPDNDQFTEIDASLWEKRLNLPIAPIGISLQDRMVIIARKYNFPGLAIYRQNWMFLQYQLQLAGFNVWVHENRFDDGMGGFTYVNYGELRLFQHGTEFEHGLDSEMGEDNVELIANSSYSGEIFDVGSYSNYRGAFFIGGETFPDRVVINKSLERSLRKLVLDLKPANTFAVLLIDFYYQGNVEFVNEEPFKLMNGQQLELVGGL